MAVFQHRFALWFYSTGMAFITTAYPILATALRELMPTDVVPTRKQLATTLLDTCYEEARYTTMLKLQNKMCTLATDAWTDNNGESAVNYVVIDEEITVFLESAYTPTTPVSGSWHPAGYGTKYHFIRFMVVVTDNTTNRLVWSSLQRAFAVMFFHDCVSHTLHLLVKDLAAQLPWLQKLEKDRRQLVRFFKTNQQSWYELRRLQQMERKCALVLPVETRWVLLTLS
ncbi:hypothetical protein PR003_g8736 [Phytophthora rubi]|uniref:DUF659 domain-containing protein n=1 Tax=Phytophthora rubi TaxID=129364 RepID=A0A6A3MZ22_9STRA|nr:hypothetical protein PR001_g7953 [Phytophthora rubi]KAE9343904.1 hypothetical protein PR003_g8736 [Phytophthora rubi]